MEIAAAGAATSSVASSITAVTLLPANARKGFVITNESTANLFVKLGPAASATDYTYKVAAGGVVDWRHSLTYTGIITGIWDAANGNARLTELG